MREMATCIMFLFYVIFVILVKIFKKNDGMKASYLCNSYKTCQHSNLKLKTFPNFKNAVQYKNRKSCYLNL